ncbi:hypothetical protein TURU_161258 [Turdus rufiventris]|nr:hypothetical protein TURU_161258 [Turdus rufiventris]
MFGDIDSGIKCALSNLVDDTKLSRAVVDAPSRLGYAGVEQKSCLCLYLERHPIKPNFNPDLWSDFLSWPVSSADLAGGTDLCLTQDNVFDSDHLSRLTLDLLHHQELD